MAKGIIYFMTTIVPGLIKIGKTGLNNFEQRMYNLEHNGYNQVVGLKRKFAIEVDDYDEKDAVKPGFSVRRDSVDEIRKAAVRKPDDPSAG